MLRLSCQWLGLVHEVLELVLLVLELEVLLLEGLLLGSVRRLSQQVGCCLAAVRVAVDVVVVQLLSCTFVKVRLVSELGRGVGALDQVVLQSLRVKRLVENVRYVHGPAELLLF